MHARHKSTQTAPGAAPLIRSGLTHGRNMFDLRFTTNVKKSIALLTDDKPPLKVMNIHQTAMYDREISRSVQDDCEIEEFLTPPVTEYVYNEYVPYFRLKLNDLSSYKMKFATKKALRGQKKNQYHLV